MAATPIPNEQAGKLIMMEALTALLSLMKTELLTRIMEFMKPQHEQMKGFKSNLLHTEKTARNCYENN